MGKITMDNGKVKKIKRGFEKFQRHNKSKNLTQKTIDYYQYVFNIFKEFLNERNIEDFTEVNKELIETFAIHLQDRDISENTVNTYLRGIRSFLYFIMDNGWLNNFKITLIKTTERKPKGYNDQQLKKLLKKPNIDKCSFAEYRNWVIINFFLNTGVRLSELTNIQIKDLDLQKETVDINYSKSRRERTLPLSKTMMKILDKYLQIRGGEPNDYLFSNIYGDRLSKGGIISAIKRYNTNRDIDKTTIHGLRHSFSRIFIQNGGTISQLRKILGHENIETTDKYVNLLVNDFKSDYNELNPLETLSGIKKSIKMK